MKITESDMRLRLGTPRMKINEAGCDNVDWKQLARYRVQGQFLGDTVIKGRGFLNHLNDY
jgi:hypothetical protein